MKNGCINGEETRRGGVPRVANIVWLKCTDSGNRLSNKTAKQRQAQLQ